MALFDEAEACLSSEQFDHFADLGIYAGEIECLVIIDSETVLLEGEESTSAREQETVAFLLSEVNPQRGQHVVVGCKTYKLGQRIKTTKREAVHLVAR